MDNPSSEKKLKTPLYGCHVAFGAKMASFAGWEMPLWYTSPTEEHLAVRERAGIFDVSHMAVFELQGTGTTEKLEWLTPTLFSSKKEGGVTYSLLMAENGGVLDDVLVYKRGAEHYWIVANAGSRDKVRAHLPAAKELEVAILALQGPLSSQFFEPIPPKMHFVTIPNGWTVSGTGYTGEKGVEIFLPKDLAMACFKGLIAKGVVPCGLAARDTLRLEKGYALYGHELSESIAPEESVSGWVLKKRTIPYLGEGKLGPTRHPVSFLLEEGIAREGAPLFLKDKEVGKVTSGAFSPCLKKGISLGLATEDPDSVVVRGKKLPIKLVTLPFI